MDERKEYDRGGDDVTSATRSGNNNSQQKLQSYSQPLGRDAIPASKRHVSRKHSLDELINPFYSDPHIGYHAAAASPEGSNAGSSLSYTHYEVSLPTSSHNKHSNSVEDISFPHPHLPPPPPPVYHSLSGSVGSVVSFPSDRRYGNAGSFLSDSGGTFTLERAMSEFGGAPGMLPEFVGNGGGTGIFRVPVRAAVHPGRPPALELRPHPLRETQAGAFLRTMVCTGTQLWAGQETGLHFWNLSDVYDVWNGRPAKRGDEGSAPFFESERTSPVVCLVADEASSFIWSGHKDGRIRSWKIPKQGSEYLWEGGEGEDTRILENTIGARTGDPGSLFKEGLSWQAHRTSVLSMIITSYGNLNLKLSSFLCYYFMHDS
ncbi:Type I inositol 1,4,5-trisphosphate 5-phosphatase 13 [Platanthera zijinensis]|uniref:Type I inositol 1,4,5-trisphosphate 5-phosphatase 13 n=1 Tax=Platanthera zijinensis TaxID=2320716 RepID=A0AAP0BPP6_9ASPA